MLKTQIMKNKYKNFAQFHKIINIVYLMIFFGLLFFMTVVYYAVKDSFFSFSTPQNKLFLGLLFAFASIFLSKFSHKIFLKKIDKRDDFSHKLQQFLSSFIVKAAILEGAGFFNITLYFETRNKVFLIFTAISVLGLLLSKPTPEMLISDLDLNSKERAYIDNPSREFEQRND